MKIKGFEKLSLVDFPGHIACVIFLAGCNFRCHFCYNKNLVIDTHVLPDIEEEKIFSYIKGRKKLLEGIVVTGGEPTVNPDLSDFILRLRRFDLAIKLDTNGTNPNVVKYLIDQKLINYVALDIKVPLNTYYVTLTHIKPALISSIKETLRILSTSEVPFELRTTVIPTVHNQYAWATMREQVLQVLMDDTVISRIPWYVQPFMPGNCIDPNFDKLPRTEQDQLVEAVTELRKTFPKAAIR
jgi:pyruvate formate lyase activating enzyme